MEYILLLPLQPLCLQDFHTSPPLSSILTSSAAFTLFKTCFHINSAVLQWVCCQAACAWHGCSPWSCLTEATHTAPQLPKPCHLHAVELLRTAAIPFVIKLNHQKNHGILIWSSWKGETCQNVLFKQMNYTFPQIP